MYTKYLDRQASANSVDTDQMLQSAASDQCLHQGSGNFEIWIGPATDDDVINEPISKKKKYVYITCHEN